MAASIVQSKIGQGTTVTLTFDSTTTSGNMIEVTCAQGDDSSSNTFTVSDNKGNSYVSVIRDTGHGNTVAEKFYCYNITGGSSHQITCNCSSSQAFSACAHEITGVPTTDPLDKTASADGYGGSPSTASSGTLAQADEIVMYAIGTRLGAVETANPTTAGFTLLGTQTASGDYGALSTLSKVVSATTAVAGDGALTPDDSWVGLLATYKASTGGGASPVPLFDYYFNNMRP